jgi:serine/threonine protein kinase
MRSFCGLCCQDDFGRTYDLLDLIGESTADYGSFLAREDRGMCTILLIREHPALPQVPARIREGAFILHDLSDLSLVPVQSIFLQKIGADIYCVLVTPSFTQSMYDIRSNSASPPDYHLCRSWMLAMAECIGYLHGVGFVHGKLELSAFCFPKGCEPDSPILATFDILKRELDSSGNVNYPQADFPINLELPYIAPELRLSGTTTKATDVYALASTFFTLRTGKAWDSNKVTEGERTHFLNHFLHLRLIDADDENLFLGMTAEAPEDRLTINQVIDHPIFHGVTYTKSSKDPLGGIPDL